MSNRVYFYAADVHRRIQFVRWTCLFTNLSKFCGAKAGKKMDEKEEIDSSFSTEGFRQLLLTKPSTLALMTTSIVLFLTFVVKRISSTQSEVRVWLKNDDGPNDGSRRLVGSLSKPGPTKAGPSKPGPIKTGPSKPGKPWSGQTPAAVGCDGVWEEVSSRISNCSPLM